MAHATALPSFDIWAALAQSLVWHRYCKRLDARLAETAGTPYLCVVCEHATRLQRLSEGLVAFSTTGVQDEVFWFLRPCFEVFASQCVLQFGNVPHPSNREMTKDEKAEAYRLHADCFQLQLLQNHENWPGHTHALVTLRAEIARLKANLANHPYSLRWDRPWHGMALAPAIKAALKARNAAFGANPLEQQIAEAFAIMKDHCNAGIHGNSYAARFLRGPATPAGSPITDDRTPRGHPNWVLAGYLATLSLEMLAEEFGERSLVSAMSLSAQKDLENNPYRYVRHFPTATIELIPSDRR